MQELTKCEKWLKLVMFVSAWAYFIVGTTFLITPNGVFGFINLIGRLFNLVFRKCSIVFQFREIPDISQGFWLTLSVAMMITIAVCSFIAQADIRRNIGFVIPVLFSKITSTIISSVLFIKSITVRDDVYSAYLAYIANAVIDGSLLLITGISLLLAIMSYKVANASLELKYFKPYQYRIIVALANSIVPADGGIKYGAGDLNTARNIDKFLYQGGPFMKRMFPLLLLLFEFGTNIFYSPFSRFTGLRLEEQFAYLEGWRRSKLAFRRQIFMALRTVVMQGYYFNEEVWSEIGYAGPWAKNIEKW